MYKLIHNVSKLLIAFRYQVTNLKYKKPYHNSLIRKSSNLRNKARS